MADHFLQLDAKEQSQILRRVAPRIQRSVAVLEKDIWVCWVLQTLFDSPGHFPMAFKGGTSLSKVFGLIDRFSEDVDITLDYRSLDASAKPFAEGLSITQIRKIGESLKRNVHDHIHGQVMPYFQEQLALQFASRDCYVTGDDNGEKVLIHYPTIAAQEANYLPPSVLLEFGGRNSVEPAESHTIRTEIASYIPDLILPEAHVSVLKPTRTFWEKATLIHVECNRKEFRANAKRLSRHWYDLAMLANSDIGAQALNDKALLLDVVKHKKVFFHSSTADYDSCISGNIRLLPHDAGLTSLRHDYQQMIVAGMFIGQPLAFERIVERITSLENQINSIFMP